jgi:hypothetical protein
MAEHGIGNTVANTAAGVVIANGVSKSGFAQSLMSASFDQVLAGHFYWQFSDVLTLACSAIVIANFIGSRFERARYKRKKQIS